MWVKNYCIESWMLNVKDKEKRDFLSLNTKSSLQDSRLNKLLMKRKKRMGPHNFNLPLLLFFLYFFVRKTSFLAPRKPDTEYSPFHLISKKKSFTLTHSSQDISPLPWKLLKVDTNWGRKWDWKWTSLPL